MPARRLSRSPSSNRADPAAAMPASSPTDAPQTPKDKEVSRLLRLFTDLRACVTRQSAASVRFELRAKANRHDLELIGEGRTAKVWDLVKLGQVVKQAKPGRTYGDLLDDFYIHCCVYDDLEASAAAARAPKPIEVMDVDLVLDWCLRGIARDDVPDDATLVQAGTALILAERVPPVPNDLRVALVRAFCPKDKQLAALMCPKNHNCVVRIYLGRHDRTPRINDEEVFSLRDFELTLDKMDKLEGIDAVQFVDPMAEALAVMHWKTQCDAAGVEFVLGTAPEVYNAWGPRSGSVTGGSGSADLNRTLRVFVLDFDRVRDITVDRDAVDKAVKAYLDNEPFFPEPVSVPYHERYKKYHLWRCFKESYRRVSATLLPWNRLHLADLFLKRVEDEYRNRLTKEVARRSVLAVIPEDSVVLEW